MAYKLYPYPRMKTKKSIQGIVITQKHFENHATVVYCDSHTTKSEIGILVKDSNYPGAIFVSYALTDRKSEGKYGPPKLTYTSDLRWPNFKKEYTVEDLLN